MSCIRGRSRRSHPRLSLRRLPPWLALAALLALSGCDGAPQPDPAAPEFATGEWDMYVTRHMGRALGRLQFRLPPGWKASYQHDTVHPRIIVANRADLQAPDVSYLVIGMTEEKIFEQKKFDGPPAVWNAADYSPELNQLAREKMDRKEVVDHNGRMGQGVRWRTTQTLPAIGDWEFVWKYGVDPGPGAADRDKQRVNKFDEYLKANPGAPVEYFREYYTLGWGLHQKAWLQIYYKARNDAIRRQLDALLPTVADYRFSETDVTLLGGVITREAWAQIAAQYAQKPAANPAP